MKANFVKMFFVVLMAMLNVAVSSGASAQLVSCTKPVSKTGEVTLVSRNIPGGNYLTATYSFRYMTQGDDLTHGNFEILYEGRSDLTDYFMVNTVTDDRSFIYDLGQRSCNTIWSDVPWLRKSQPLVWLENSEANPDYMAPTVKAPVKENHCYLANNSDSDGQIMTLFHVKKFYEHEGVTINEIEVLYDSNKPK